MGVERQRTGLKLGSGSEPALELPWWKRGKWGVVNVVRPPEVQHNLLCLLHIEGQIVSVTPFSQLCHFLSVVRFIVVADETYHCCVISKLDDVVGAELGSTVVGQQREEQQPCGAPVLSVVVLEVLWPTRTD